MAMTTPLAHRIGIYARYSTDLQRDASIEDQVRLCREYIAGRLGGQIVEVYPDYAESGRSLAARAGVQRLLEDARRGRLDLVLTEGLDRLSRDQEDIAGIYKRLRFADVRLLTVQEGEINEMHIGFKGTANALFLIDLGNKTRRGLRGRIEDGKAAGGLCYGYDVVHEEGPKGPVRGGRRINAEQADIVRRIFKDYAHGLSPKAIAHALNREGVPGPSGKAWGPSTINGNRERGTGILNNELYIGVLVWNRQKFVTTPDGLKRVARLNPAEQWTRKEVPDLRIVDQALWDRVKARQGGRRAEATGAAQGGEAFWDRRRPRYLFSGLIVCGCCGGGFSKISANLFGCSTARNKGPTACSNRQNIRRDVLEATVLDSLKTHLMEPTLFKEFCTEFHREANRLRALETQQVDRWRADLEKLERQIASLADRIVELEARAPSLTAKLLEMEERRKELMQRLADAPAPKPLLHPSLAEVYRQRVCELHEAVGRPEMSAEATDLIRSLVEAIVITPEEGGPRITLRGALAGILALCTGHGQPGVAGATGLAEQMKLVAGAGFEPATFRL